MSALNLEDRSIDLSLSHPSSSSQQADRSSIYAGLKDNCIPRSTVVNSALTARLGQKQQPSPPTLSSSSSSPSSPPSPHQLAPLRFDGESNLSSLSQELGSYLSGPGPASGILSSSSISSPLASSPTSVSRVPQVLPSQTEPCPIVVTTTATAQPVSSLPAPPSDHVSLNNNKNKNKNGDNTDAAARTTIMSTAAAVLSSVSPPPTSAPTSSATASQASVDFSISSKGPTLPSPSSLSLSSLSSSIPQQQQLSSFPTSYTIPTMSLPSPPTLPSDTIINEEHTLTISLEPTSDEQHLKIIAQQYHQLMTPSVSYKSDNPISGDTTPISRISLSDSDPSPSRMSTSSQSSFSSNDGSSPRENNNGYQLSDGPSPSQQQQQHPGHSHRPMMIVPPPLEQLIPVPQKSEDWAALIDTPASPIERFHPSRMKMLPPLPPPVIGGPSGTAAGPQPSSPSSPSQFQAGPHPRSMAMTTMLSGAAYTDSPGPDTSADYIQHQPQQQQYHQYHMYHAQTDPGPRQQQQLPYPHHHLPYQHHQHHNSTPSFHGASEMADACLNDSGTAPGIPSNGKTYRKSWSASETLDAYGTLTPPRMNLDYYRGSQASSSRGSLNSNKPPSAAMSVSLLTDAAILAKYRDTANKTNDATIQLSFAKYLLEIGDPSSTFEPVVDEGNAAAAALPPRPSSVGSNNSPPSSAPSSPPSGPLGPKTGKKQLILEGVYWIDRLAKEGHPEAQYIRGTWYEEGMYLTKKNADKALRWYQSSSKGDYGPAHYKVAYFCEKKKDNNKSVMLYKKAAIHNDVPANHRLAMVYLYGDLGQSKNMKAGLLYLKRAATLANEAAPMSPYVLGLILSRDYSNQLAIPDDISFPDDGEALEWFRKSAQLGYGPANYKLGYCYEYGSLGCPIDPFLSVQHYERATMGSDSNGEAEMALSGWYLSGADNCFAADDRLAFHYASLAAEKNLPKAQYAMGYYHEVGISVQIDLEKAMEFYKKAAENGNKDAKKRLEEQSAKFDPLGHKNSIKRMKNERRGGRGPKDQSCSIM